MENRSKNEHSSGPKDWTRTLQAQTYFWFLDNGELVSWVREIIIIPRNLSIHL